MFPQITIRMRLIVSMSVLGLMIAAVGITGLIGMRTVNADLRDVNENTLPSTLAVADLQIALARARLAMDRVIIAPDDPGSARTLQRAQAFMDDAEQAWRRYSALPLAADEQALAATLDQRRRAYIEGYQHIMAALQRGDHAQVEQLALTAIQPLFAKMSESAGALGQYQARTTQATYAASQATYASQTRITLAAIAFGALLIAFTLTSLLRHILVPLRQAQTHFGAIAGGDLSQAIEVGAPDEMGELLRGLRTMQQQLAATVSEVRDGASAIAGASTQIAAGNLDLSSRTEQQAASLEETAASLEQLTGAVRENAASVRQANTLAISAAGVARQGGTLVTQVVGTMDDISATAREIADITGVIDSLAFQTNILALNAAVEAARAGEQGRGFAVVASEVRVLAQRSATAAKDIRNLIDASVNKVDAGGRLVAQTGATMQEMIDSVGRVTTVMEQISNAGREQEAGIEQINHAVAEMDAVTQQNAALVEEAAAAAAALREQAAQLSASVSVFTLEAAGRAAMATAASAPQPHERQHRAPPRLALVAPLGGPGQSGQA